jgi:hypothetical protein
MQADTRIKPAVSMIKRDKIVYVSSFHPGIRLERSFKYSFLPMASAPINRAKKQPMYETRSENFNFNRRTPLKIDLPLKLLYTSSNATEFTLEDNSDAPVIFEKNILAGPGSIRKRIPLLEYSV